jgi:hypothetical protein
MAVRAKFRCTRRAECTDRRSREERHHGNLVTMQAVYGEDGDDKAEREWSKWTPSGELEMSITNPEAFKQFKIGKAYFVDLTPAEG